MRVRNGNGRLWGDAIDEFRRNCEVMIWLSGNRVCNSNVARFVQEVCGLTIPIFDDASYVGECLLKAGQRKANDRLLQKCREYFEEDFRKLPQAVRSEAAEQVLRDLQLDEAVSVATV